MKYFAKPYRNLTNITNISWKMSTIDQEIYDIYMTEADWGDLRLKGYGS